MQEYSMHIIIMNEQFLPYVIKRKELLKIYKEKDISTISFSLENMKLLILQLMELFRAVLDFQGILEQFLQISEVIFIFF